ncbi:MAG: GNAT family N-acetyltransferase [Coleofasciculaceae cyanobacterium SM2_3_26]|nr:GNAT family N-acetyltransferase [Coleofasciculaceae cyanobacterium SM2_3_26]
MSTIEKKTLNIQFRQLVDVNHPDFQAALDIYNEAFPIAERSSVARVKQIVQNNWEQMYLGYLGDRVVFLGILYELEGTDFVLLSYIATEKNYRNQGIGSQFIEQLLVELKFQKKYLLLEVKTPKGESDKVSWRRIAFYRRLGAKELKGVNYFVPALSGNTPTESILMILPEYHQPTLAGAFVKQLIYKLYVEGYDRPDTDPLLLQLLAGVGDRVELV